MATKDETIRVQIGQVDSVKSRDKFDANGFFMHSLNFFSFYNLHFAEKEHFDVSCIGCAHAGCARLYQSKWCEKKTILSVAQFAAHSSHRDASLVISIERS